MSPPLPCRFLWFSITGGGRVLIRTIPAQTPDSSALQPDSSCPLSRGHEADVGWCPLLGGFPPEAEGGLCRRVPIAPLAPKPPPISSLQGLDHPLRARRGLWRSQGGGSTEVGACGRERSRPVPTGRVLPAGGREHRSAFPTTRLGWRLLIRREYRSVFPTAYGTKGGQLAPLPPIPPKRVGGSWGTPAGGT